MSAKQMAAELVIALKALKKATELVPKPSPQEVEEFQSSETIFKWHLEVEQILNKYPGIK